MPELDKMTADELTVERSRLEADLIGLIDRHGDDESAWTEGVATRARNLGTAVNKVQGQLDGLAARASRLDGIRRAATSGGGYTENGFSGAPQFMKRTADTAFDDLERVAGGQVDQSAVRSRALAGIESAPAQGVDDAARSAAFSLVETRPNLARQALLTASPAYRSAFEKILANPTDFHLFLDRDEAEAVRASKYATPGFFTDDVARAALSETNANGGYALPFLLDPSVILTNQGSANPMRQIATLKQISTNKWNGITSAGVTAEWKTEGAAAADASPTIGQPSISTWLADAYVFGSYEVFADTNLASELPMLIADAKDRLEASAHFVGTGSGQPFGVVTQVTAATGSRVSPTTGGTFTTSSAVDVFNLEKSVPARWRPKASWAANWQTYSVIRQMSPLSQGSNFWATMVDGLPDKLIGHRQYESTAMTATITTGSNIMVVGDFSQYYVVDRIGLNLEYVQNVFDASTARPTGQRGWLAWWRTGGDVVAADAFRVLKL